MKNSILVTGASGNIGKELVKELRAKGIAFETLSSKPGGGGRVATFESVADLTQAFAGIDTVFVVLPLVPHKLQLARNVAQAALAAGVKHIVRASGEGANPQSPFALARLQGQIDDVFTQSGIASTFLRNAGFMQNYATFMAQMVKDGTIYTSNNDVAQALVDVRDIAAVAANILREPQAHAGKAYTLTGGQAQTDSQRIAVLQAVTGRELAHVQITVEQASGWMREQWHMPEDLVQLMASLSQYVQAGHASHVSPDVAKLLGREPVRFEDFAREHADAWRVEG
jgi:uncharacterized protein YbjT (DUF2867 family)